ncbi:MAG: hypothetical protein WKF87_19045 [Chryseolinea sp.]
MKMRISVLLIFFFFACESRREVAIDEKVKLYGDVLDQLITEHFYQLCLPPNEVTDSARSDFFNNKITEEKFLRIGDSLKRIRKNALPRCVVDYTNEFQIFRDVDELPADIIATINERLKGDFIDEHFKGEAMSTVTDSLSKPAELRAADLAVGYMEIVPRGARKDKPYGEGIGVFALSRVYFNSQADRAILYYEFTCGPKCGLGDVVFLEKTINMWAVIEYKRVWEL